MYEITPQKSNKKAQQCSAVLLITSFAAMFFSAMTWVAYRSIIQIIALVMMGISVLLLTRYVLSGYTYAIVANDDGSHDITVTELKRKSRITVCRIGLSSIERVVCVDRSNKEAIAQEAKTYKRFNYCVDIRPDKSICFFAEECEEKFAITLSYDQKLFDILSAAAKE